ncbi:MAG: hypothetical protein IPI07_03260 [Flavobacteriales bacterium]|nr:hypothetical protein [Flavobacteriales bacterium]
MPRCGWALACTVRPGYRKIVVFNNRVEPGTSAVDIFVPPVDGNGNYAYTPGTAYGPLDREQRFALATPTDLNSPGRGSAQKLYTGMCSLPPAARVGIAGAAR